MVWEPFRGLGLPQRDVFGLDCSKHAMGPSDFCGFHGFHKDFAIYCSWKFEVHGPGGLVCTWVGNMHANSAQ